MKIWKWFLAYFRLDKNAVCEMSVGEDDYHDYPDSLTAEPWHFYNHTCKQCGKKFSI